MRIQTVNINLNSAPSAISRAFIEALLSGPELSDPVSAVTNPDDQTAPEAPKPMAAKSTASIPPRVGEVWPDQGGIYAGIARGFDGEPDGHLVLLPDEPTDKLNWAAANDWAQRLGNDARLPKRFESALLYANLRDKIDIDGWYWTGTQSSDNYAFVQHFYDGFQDVNYLKSSEGRARAVRRLAL